MRAHLSTVCSPLIRSVLTYASFRRLAIYGMVGATCYLVWDHVIAMPWKNFDPRPFPKGVLDPDEPVEPLFLPFPFTDKLVVPLPYAGSDEEWQDFIKFNSDQKLRRRVKDDLTMLVKRAAEKNPITKKWAKEGESFQLGPAWLIMSFPQRPPAMFVRTGYVTARRCYTVAFMPLRHELTEF